MARRPVEARDIGTSYIVGIAAVYRLFDKAPQIYLAHVPDSSQI
jgi:hypothetical protein